MNQDSTFYWSHISAYEGCPQSFLWKKGWDGIDLGRGPGKGKKKPEQASEHHAVAGCSVQYAVEKLYNDELYVEPHTLSTRLEALAEREWARQEKRRHIDYGEARKSRNELLRECRQAVRGYVQTMKAHKFLGPYARAEVKLIGWVDKWTAIGGIADVIIRRDDTGLTILDGKNTKHKMKYTNPDQLRWYALCFFLSYKVMPDRLGFVWYRFPHGMETTDDEGNTVVETGVEWIPFTREDLQGLAQRAIEARNGMRKGKFDADPSPPKCKFCDFESVCPERQAQRIHNARNRAPSKIPELPGNGGFSDFSI